MANMELVVSIAATAVVVWSLQSILTAAMRPERQQRV